MLEELGTFKDSAEILGKIRYDRATAFLGEKKYQEAHDMFVAAGSYSDAAEKANESYYELGKAYLAEKNYDKSNPIFEELGDYKDSASLTHYHNYKVIKTVKATCTANGKKTYKCEGCGHSYVKTLSSTGHNYSSATCTAPKKCTKCGATSGSALGHTSGGTTCSRCGTVTFKSITYSGSGDRMIENINLPSGRFKITLSVSGGGENGGYSYFYLKNANDSSLANCSIDMMFDANNTTSDIFSGPLSNGYLDITGNRGSWTIKIEAKE